MTLSQAMVFRVTRMYTARSELLIEPQPSRAVGIGTDHSAAAADDTYYNTQCGILESRSIAVEVINALRLAGENQLREVKDGPTSPRREVVDAYLRRLRVRPGTGRRLVTIAFSTPDPELSARIVNRHVEAYLQRWRELYYPAGLEAQPEITPGIGQAQFSRSRVGAGFQGVVVVNRAEAPRMPSDPGRMLGLVMLGLVLSAVLALSVGVGLALYLDSREGVTRPWGIR